MRRNNDFCLKVLRVDGKGRAFCHCETALAVVAIQKIKHWIASPKKCIHSDGIEGSQ